MGLRSSTARSARSRFTSCYCSSRVASATSSTAGTTTRSSPTTDTSRSAPVDSRGRPEPVRQATTRLPVATPPTRCCPIFLEGLSGSLPSGSCLSLPAAGRLPSSGRSGSRSSSVRSQFCRRSNADSVGGTGSRSSVASKRSTTGSSTPTRGTTSPVSSAASGVPAGCSGVDATKPSSRAFRSARTTGTTTSTASGVRPTTCSVGETSRRQTAKSNCRRPRRTKGLPPVSFVRVLVAQRLFEKRRPPLLIGRFFALGLGFEVDRVQLIQRIERAVDADDRFGEFPAALVAHLVVLDQCEALDTLAAEVAFGLVDALAFARRHRFPALDLEDERSEVQLLALDLDGVRNLCAHRRPVPTNTFEQLFALILLHG